MSDHIYEQSFSIELTSKLHVTDEFKQKFGMDTLSHYFGNEIEDEDVKSALEDPMKAVMLDSKEVLCALALGNHGFFYGIPKRIESYNGESVSIKDEVVHTKITFDNGVYCFKVSFGINTVFDHQLTTENVMMWLPAIVVAYGTFAITEASDVKVTDADEVFDKTKAYCSLATRTYFDADRDLLLELPDKLNVTILLSRGNKVVKVLTYRRDLYDICTKHLREDEEYQNRYYFDICDSLLVFFDYGYERLDESADWDSDDIYINDPIVKPSDELSISEFLNEYLNAYENFEATDDTKYLINEDGEFRSDIVWTEVLLDKIMLKFGFKINFFMNES